MIRCSRRDGDGGFDATERETGQTDLFRTRLDQILNLGHPLAKLAGAIDWSVLEKHFGAVYDDDPGRPPLPTRRMAGLAILKHLHDLSDEALCERWIENPYDQLFCGEEVFQHTLPFDRSSGGRRSCAPLSGCSSHLFTAQHQPINPLDRRCSRTTETGEPRQASERLARRRSVRRKPA